MLLNSSNNNHMQLHSLLTINSKYYFIFSSDLFLSLLIDQSVGFTDIVL